MDLSRLLTQLRGGVIVSCQALVDEPLFGSEHMAAMARAAAQGGAVAIRANGPADIAAIRAKVQLPVIGLFKEDIASCEVRITPTRAHADQIARAGSDVIACDATRRLRQENLTVKQLIDHIHERLGLPVLADVSTFDEGMEAAEAGTDFVATTRSGCTGYSPSQAGPAFNLLKQLVAHLHPKGLPVIAEGRISTPDLAAQALVLGAYAVVVGGAITRPQWITAQFVNVLKKV